MQTSCSLAVAQFPPIAYDIQANVQNHRKLAALAASQGTSVVVFPELSLTGYELELAVQHTIDENAECIGTLREVAALHNVLLIVGAPVRRRSGLNIGAYAIYPDGRTVLYTKQRLGAFTDAALCDSVTGALPPPESTIFQSGESHPVIEYLGQTVGLAVCADVGQPAHAAKAAASGARFYLASMFVIPSDFQIECSRLSQYAGQHGMITALSNFGGPSGGLRSAGRSSIWSDTGELLVQLGEEDFGIATVIGSDNRLVAQAFTC
jgi:predicted amidohydrolase